MEDLFIGQGSRDPQPPRIDTRHSAKLNKRHLLGLTALCVFLAFWLNLLVMYTGPAGLKLSEPRHGHLVGWPLACAEVVSPDSPGWVPQVNNEANERIFYLPFVVNCLLFSACLFPAAYLLVVRRF